MAAIRPRTLTEKTNALIHQMTPYLNRWGLETFPPFVQKRIEAQIDEIGDRHHQSAARMFFLFTIGRVEEATALAEELVEMYPSDTVSWGNYALCMAFRVNVSSAIEICFRGFEKCHAPYLLENGCCYASFIGDYNTVLKGSELLARIGAANMSKHNDAHLSSVYQQALMAKESGRLEEIEAVGRLMEKLVSMPGGQRTSILSPPTDPDDDSDSYLFEVLFCDRELDAQQCAELNIRLIDERIKVGLTDWGVMGSFLSAPLERIYSDVRHTS